MKVMNIRLSILQNQLKIALIALSIVFICACSMFSEQQPVDNITVIEQGKYNEKRSNMQSVCKGFYVSPEKFAAFYQHSTIDQKAQINERYQALPCYSAGTVVLDGKPFKWILRSGGIGEFYSEDSKFTKVCGIACCKKVSGVC